MWGWVWARSQQLTASLGAQRILRQKGQALVRIPAEVPKKVHMIAACGTGMGALALLFREMGVQVSGSDVQAYPPMGDLLRKAGVELSLGYGPENLPKDTDFVVVGNAVSKDNPEVEEMLERGLPYGSFPESLAHFFLNSRCPIVVAGTHGKTTSTALLAWLLECSGEQPGFLVGGEPTNFGSSSRLGKGKYFVIEGDEYDSAFFDKGPKFLHYRPGVALFTSLEFDHADIYPDLDSIREQFLRFVALMPPEGLVMVCNEYPDAVEIARKADCTVETYGYGKDADWVGVLEEPPGVCGSLEISFRGRSVGTVPLPLSGRHNRIPQEGPVRVVVVQIDAVSPVPDHFRQRVGVEIRRGVSGLGPPCVPLTVRPVCVAGVRSAVTVHENDFRMPFHVEVGNRHDDVSDNVSRSPFHIPMVVVNRCLVDDFRMTVLVNVGNQENSASVGTHRSP